MKKQQKEDSPKKEKITKKIIIPPTLKKDEFFVPKNVNEYRHIIKCYYSRESDLEWMLKLRRHKKIRQIPKETSPSPPGFYEEDFNKYKTKTEADNSSKKKFLKTNLAIFKHIVTRPYLNNSLYSFETTLRSEPNKTKLTINPIPWRSINFSPKKNLFDTYLPPVLQQSKENLLKLKDQVSRPLIQVNSKVNVNGEEIRQRKFQLSTDRTSRSPFEHFGSNKYNDKYGIKNVNSIKHIMNFDNSNTNTLWECALREYNKKIMKTDNK